MEAYKDDELIAEGRGPLDELSDFAKRLLEHGKADRVEIHTKPKPFKQRIREFQK